MGLLAKTWSILFGMKRPDKDALAGSMSMKSGGT